MLYLAEGVYDVDEWICPECGYGNTGNQTKCMQCGFEHPKREISIIMMGALLGALFWFLVYVYFAHFAGGEPLGSAVEAGMFYSPIGFLLGLFCGLVGAKVGSSKKKKIGLVVFLTIIVSGIGSFFTLILGLILGGQ